MAFHSQRGGVGRTATVANCAVRLALQGDRVFVIDLDLEAPGLSLLWGQAKEHERDGFVEFAASALESDMLPAVGPFVHTVDVESAKIRFMPAGRLDDDYGKRLAATAVGRLFDPEVDGRGPWVVEGLRQAIRDEAPHYVLVDSRPGLSDVAAVATGMLADLVIEVFTLGRQSRLGLRRFLRVMQHRVGARPIVPVATMVMRGDEARNAIAEMEEIWGRSFSGQCPFDADVFLRERVVLDSGELAQAYQGLVRSLRTRNPYDVFTLVEQARFQLQSPGGLVAVEAAIDRAAAIDSEDARLLQLRGHYHLLRKEYGSAISVAERLATEHQDDAETWKLVEGIAASVPDDSLRARAARLYEHAPAAVAIPADVLAARLLAEAFALGEQALGERDFKQGQDMRRQALKKLKEATEASGGPSGDWWRAVAQRLPVRKLTEDARDDLCRWSWVAADHLPEIAPSIQEVLAPYVHDVPGTVSRFGWEDFGFIRLDDGEADVYFNRTTPGFPASGSVRVGSRLTCDIELTFKGWRAVRIEFTEGEP
ncbi:MAG: AAA family ATPase [Deltaproteobacteria bacterium]|nr:AAA family ATPase [Deltaproteobacteria bacterium]